jgi:hypothetical protein
VGRTAIDRRPTPQVGPAWLDRPRVRGALAALAVFACCTAVNLAEVDAWDFHTYRGENNLEFDKWTALVGVLAALGIGFLARRLRQPTLALVGIVWLAVVANDVLARGWHGIVADRVRRTQWYADEFDRLPGNAFHYANLIGEAALAIPLGLLCVVALVRTSGEARRTAWTLTAILALLFVFAAGFDTLDGLLDARVELGMVEELGESLTTALALAAVVYRCVLVGTVTETDGRVIDLTDEHRPGLPVRTHAEPRRSTVA